MTFTPERRTFVCETCLKILTVPKQDRVEAMETAREKGWTIRYTGPNSGSESWCPDHANHSQPV